MLHRLHDYARLAILATDGELGRLNDCLFDDARWKIRYVLVNASLFARKIAISPLAIRNTHWTSGEMTSCLALKHLLAAAVNSTIVADENLTGRQHVWLPAEGLAPGR